MDPNIGRIFQSVDRDNSGHINAQELQAALGNGMGTPFDITCISLMITTFDRDDSGTINQTEFIELYNNVIKWQNAFYHYDCDRSGSIDHNEFNQALCGLGYRLNPQFITWLMLRFDKQRLNKLSFEKFAYILTCLHNLTTSFSALDLHQHHQVPRGVVTMSFDQFLRAAFSMCV